ncbi:MAG: hypothetical protein R2752_01225 [Vicinamibacterales bacterium]
MTTGATLEACSRAPCVGGGQERAGADGGPSRGRRHRRRDVVARLFRVDETQSARRRRGEASYAAEQRQVARNRSRRWIAGDRGLRCDVEEHGDERTSERRLNLAQPVRVESLRLAEGEARGDGRIADDHVARADATSRAHRTEPVRDVERSQGVGALVAFTGERRADLPPIDVSGPGTTAAAPGGRAASAALELLGLRLLAALVEAFDRDERLRPTGAGPSTVRRRTTRHAPASVITSAAVGRRL